MHINTNVIRNARIRLLGAAGCCSKGDVCCWDGDDLQFPQTDQARTASTAISASGTRSLPEIRRGSRVSRREASV